jgi:hexosaminidase
MSKFSSGELPLVPYPRSWRPTEGCLTAEQAAGLEPECRLGSDDGGKENYRLLIRPDSVTITAGDEAGTHYGLSTWRRLLAASADGWDIPCGVIDDGPAFAWRGMLLDCGRHFMDTAFIKRLIDLLDLHKCNILHWHLTEDQGWRLEVPGLPKLTEIAAWRKGPDGSSYGGFYTADDVREIVAYAADRHITIVPEIELPGHCLAALAAYPELSCTGGPHEVGTQWGIFEDVYCAGGEETFSFLERVLTHVMELFPSSYIHIGGDEVPKDRWHKCPRCQERMRSEGLAGENELQSWFIRRIGKFLSAHGRYLIGWDEILDGGLAPGATVQSWQGFEGAIAAVKAGHNAIVSPTSHCYFDYPVEKLNLEKVYSFDPVPAGLDTQQITLILGGQLNLWTERIPQDRVDTMLFPRLCAMAECLWSGSARPGFEHFELRLDGHLRRLREDPDLRVRSGGSGNS